MLPGTADVAASDAPFGQGKGYIFDAVLAAGGTLRNYGFLTRNVGPIALGGQPLRNAGAAGVQQVVALNRTMFQPGITDPYFRGYDNAYPDTWRFNEWKREFDQYVRNGNLPTMETVRFHHDHTGSFGSALGKVNTPETQIADNDLAVGKLVDAVAHSPYAKDTLVFVIEDDSQDGPDHIDSHRTTAYIVGPYVKKHAVVGRRYTTVNWLRTIEDVLGLEHLNLNTAYQRPMTDVFDVRGDGRWSYDYVASTILKKTDLASDAGNRFLAGAPDLTSTHDAAWWEEKTKGLDFSVADALPAARYNRLLWEGLVGDRPYPARAPDLRADAAEVGAASGVVHGTEVTGASVRAVPADGGEGPGAPGAHEHE